MRIPKAVPHLLVVDASSWTVNGTEGQITAARILVCGVGEIQDQQLSWATLNDDPTAGSNSGCLAYLYPRPNPTRGRIGPVILNKRRTCVRSSKMGPNRMYRVLCPQQSIIEPIAGVRKAEMMNGTL